jgi:hypothetical protein
MQRTARAGFLLLTYFILLLSCEKEGKTRSSFDLIQEDILTPSCALSGCHSSASDPAFAEHGLILKEGESYDNLVGVSPKNSNAFGDGLQRVKEFKSAESLLYHKIHTLDHHSNDYGNPMPLGLPLLSQGQVEFIRQWIDNGAPREGIAANEEFLQDVTPQDEPFEALPAPAAGYQMKLGPFEVAPNFEREFFLYQKVGNTEEAYVNRIEIRMRINSHHFILYDFSEDAPPSVIPSLDLVRDIRNTNGTYNIQNLPATLHHVFVAGSQTPNLDFTFPAGVAILLPPDRAYDMNSHYVNKQSVPITGEVHVNLHTVPSAQVLHIAKALNLPNNSLTLLPNQRTTVTKEFLMDQKTYVISLTSHTHKLGEKFVIRIKGGSRNGEAVYTNTDWHNAKWVPFDPPIVLNAGEGLISEITYNNTTSKTVSFGLTSEDEMGIIFGYFYTD